MNAPRSILTGLLALLALVASAQVTPAPAPAAPPLFRAHGVRINVPSLNAGLEFYRDFLGFAVAETSADGKAVALRPDERAYTHIQLVEHPRTGQLLYRRDTHTSFTLHVHDIRAWLARCAEKNVRLMDNHVRIEQVGLAATIADPWGATISLMDTTQDSNPPPPEPRMYNYGLYLPMNAYARSRKFWCDDLGLLTLTDRYLPLDQALFSADRKWGFMLHMREGASPRKGEYPGYGMAIIQLATPDLDAALEKLRTAGAELITTQPLHDPWGRRLIAFREPFGVPIEVVEIK